MTESGRSNLKTISVHPRCGPVRGQLDEERRVRVFRGIPYAAPPIGDLRWRPPQPRSVWTAERDATRDRPHAIQNPPPSNSLFAMPSRPQSEDCLQLSVWTPVAEPQSRLPVMVWFHLGAFQYGSGSSPLYDGTRWAEAGVVLITVNFRLSKLGFLAHPDLVDEGGGNGGNYGLLDQLAALRWVQANVDAFGGDPECVTICGVSSGASSVALLMASPAARGLFHRAIAESGGAFGPVAATTGIGDSWQDLESACASGRAWSLALGAPGAADLRRLTADAVRAASAPPPGATTGVLDAARPIIDGALLAESPHAAFAAGRQAPVPLLVGCAADEDLAMFNYPRDLATYRRLADTEHGGNIKQFLQLYPATTDDTAVAAGLRSNGHRLFTWQNWRWANLHSAAGHPTYYYRFAAPPPVPASRYAEQALPRPLGAFHGASLFSTFGGAATPREWPWTGQDIALATTVREAWVCFARNGRPAAEHLPQWSTFDGEHPAVMVLDTRGCALTDVPERDYLRFWDAFYGHHLLRPPPPAA